MAFRDNPFQRNAFDAFPLRKDETSIRAIRQHIQLGRESWRDHGGKVLARDGTEWELTEAQLNSLEKAISDPLSRLQVEQYVHQQHYFTEDAELTRHREHLAGDLAPAGLPPDVLDALSAALSARLTRLLPEPAPARLADDLPWPESPVPFPLELLPIEQLLLRES